MHTGLIALWVLVVVLIVYGVCLAARAAYVCRSDPRKQKYGCPRCLPLVSEGFAHKMEGLVHRYTDVMRREGIDSWATAGTLLGIVRGIGHMPWDDDADFAIRASDLERFQQINWAHYGLKIRKLPMSLQVYEKWYDGRWVDVFVYEPDPRDPSMWQFQNKAARKMWPKERFSHASLFPLRPAQFGSVSVLTPCNARDVAVASYSHDAIGHVRVKPMHVWTAVDWPFVLANGSFPLKEHDP